MLLLSYLHGRSFLKSLFKPYHQRWGSTGVRRKRQREREVPIDTTSWSFCWPIHLIFYGGMDPYSWHLTSLYWGEGSGELRQRVGWCSQADTYGRDFSFEEKQGSLSGCLTECCVQTWLCTRWTLSCWLSSLEIPRNWFNLKTKFKTSLVALLEWPYSCNTEFNWSGEHCTNECQPSASHLLYNDLHFKQKWHLFVACWF